MRLEVLPMMSEITITNVEELHSSENTAKEDHTNGYPGRAGYVGNACAYCNDCVPEEYEQDKNVILCNTECDAPGVICDVCHDVLPTRIIQYY